jgi:hypothetical protein
MVVSKKMKVLVAAALAGLGICGSSARAATVLTTNALVDGWQVTYPVGIALVQDDNNSNGPVLELEKMAAFTSLEGLVITFSQSSYSAAPSITILDESVTNISGSDWNGFQFLLTSPLAPTLPAASFTSSFNNSAIGPFTTSSVSGDAVSLSGGTLANDSTGLWGFGPTGGELVIAANPSASGMRQIINLKELPNTSGGGTGPMVPLPAAVWSGLTGLLGLAIFTGMGRIRRALA